MSISPTGQNESEVSAMQQFRLRNQNGFEVVLLNYGASIQSIRVPTPHGPVDNREVMINADGFTPVKENMIP